MAQQNLQDTDTGPVAKDKIQGNFTELYAGVAQAESDAIAAAAADATSKANAAQSAAIATAATDATTKANAAQSAAIAAASTDATTKANAAQAAAIAAAATDATAKANAAAAASVPLTQKGAANGVATLDGNSKIPAAQIPDIAISDYLGAAANQAAMLALAGQKGDWCVRTDFGTTWIITGSDPTVLGGWTQLSYPTAPVTSVAGKTGAVTLAPADVGLANAENKTFAVGVADATAAADSKTTPVDADSIPASDSAASGALKRFTWANIKSALGSLFASRGAVASSGLTMATARLLGRNTASSGAVEEITLGTNLSMTGTTLNATGGGSPGGTDGQIQRNSGGSFAGSNISQDAAGRITVAAGTQTTAGSALNLSYTANGAGQEINGLTVQATNTASATTSMPVNIRVGASALFTARRDGVFFFGQPASGNVALAFANNVEFHTAGFYGARRQFFRFNGDINVMNEGGFSIAPGAAGDNAGDVALCRESAGLFRVVVNPDQTTDYRDLKLRNLIATQLIQTTALTVATLPAAASWPGAEAYVTDANAPTVGSTVASGGSGRARVSSNGTNWIVTAVI